MTFSTSNTTPATTPRPLGKALPGEPVMSLPTWKIVAAVIVAACFSIGGWALASMLDLWGLGGTVAFRSGIVGGLIVAAIAIASVFLLMPWKERPMGLWMSMWLGTTAFRLLLVPIVVYAVFSSARNDLSVNPLVFSVALTYFCTLMAEAVVLAKSVSHAEARPMTE